MTKASVAIFLSTLLVLAAADVYLQNPRGMNDRCDEESNDRNNEQRMYNSNDNAAGGYSWCDQEMVFYENTMLRIEWTAQHSCGNGATNLNDPTDPESTICQQILQLGCDPTFKLFAWGPWPSEYSLYSVAHGQSLGRYCSDQYSMTQNCLTNPMGAVDAFTTWGDTCTQTRPLMSSTCPNGFYDIAACDTDLSQGTSTFNSATCQCSTRKSVTYGWHEPENWYLRCVARQRQGGLFTADQQPNPAGGSENTRQEPNSARYGYECTEERDYYPYFYPTPWIDIVVLTTETENCSYYQAQSQNVVNRCECLADPSNNASWYQCLTSQNPNCPSYFITNSTCRAAGFNWTCYGEWYGWPNVDCQLALASTDNRLGNTNLRGDTPDDLSHDATMAYYQWTIPNGAVSIIYNAVNQNLAAIGINTPLTYTDTVRCTIRLRYNISTAETLWNFDYLDNGRISTNPVKQYGNPLPSSAFTSTTSGSSGGSPTPTFVDNTANTVPVRLAVNTAQYGRTFQDRTYVFQIKQRSALPSQVNSASTIWNINVRGKRGNIAQVRNCVEYDYIPNNLNVNVGDWILFQWCGSDYNDQGNAGEGRNGQDRTNVVAVVNLDYRRNYPNVVPNLTTIFSSTDLLALAWIGQNPAQCYSTVSSLTTNKNSNQDPMSCHYLNGPRVPGTPYMPTAYFSYFAQVISSGTLNFMGSRNNNFSNRSQKGTIIANNGLSAGAIAGIVIGSVVGVALIIVAVLVVGSVLGFFSLKIGFGKFASRV